MLIKTENSMKISVLSKIYGINCGLILFVNRLFQINANESLQNVVMNLP